MRQKYVISRDDDKKRLKISEYAVVEKNLKKAAAPMLRQESFSLLYEEFYEKDMIMESIAKGMDALVGSLRTPNVYPIEPYAEQIAESVAALYDSSEEKTVALFFDDINLIPPKEEEDD